MWLGNLTAGVTPKMLRDLFGQYGPVVDAAVFPGRIGPLGFAFLNFERVQDASDAYDALNNVVVAAITGDFTLIWGVGG